jgi:hypothetical protein
MRKAIFFTGLQAYPTISQREYGTTEEQAVNHKRR